MTTRIGPIQEDEVKPMVFDFTNEGISGVIVSAVVEAINYRGKDPSPSTVPVGEPVIDGLLVRQTIQYQVPNSTYLLRCEATDSAGFVHVITASLLAKAVA